MSDESSETTIKPDTIAASTVFQPHDWQKLTPLDLLRFARRWSIKSWLFVIGVAAVISFGSWSAGFAYRAANCPKLPMLSKNPTNRLWLVG